jgi:N6-L-threonylcarbamoyladenine synthase
VAGGELTVLGFETSCDETAAAIVRRDPDGRGFILADQLLSQISEHRAYGGVVPEIAARSHIRHLDGLATAALGQAALTFADLDGVAATAGPGLAGGLIVGLMTAKGIALATGLPLIAVNHLEAHVLTPGLTEGLRPPYLVLLVSGGHTQTLGVADIGHYRRYGTTLDDALGEAFDKTAKLLGLPYPGGPAVEQRAAAGDPCRFDLPRPLIGRDDCHFSFSGLKTAVRHAVDVLGTLSDRDIADIAASFQAAVTDTLTDRLGRAMERFLADFQPVTPVLVVAGGVAANQVLRQAIGALCAARGFRLSAPPPELCTDNAAMVAWAGAEHLARGVASPLDVPHRARWPLDQNAAPAPFAGVKG